MPSQRLQLFLTPQPALSALILCSASRPEPSLSPDSAADMPGFSHNPEEFRRIRVIQTTEAQQVTADARTVQAALVGLVLAVNTGQGTYYLHR